MMRLNLIKMMQTVPKEHKGAPYNENDLLKALAIACEIENVLHHVYGKNKNKDLKEQKYKSLYYVLNMKYTNLKTSLLCGDIKVTNVICLNQTDFFNEEEK